MYRFNSNQFTFLDERGLNIQAVFDLDALPGAMRDQLIAEVGELAPFRQLLLIGHAGRLMWQCMKASGIQTANPVDDYSCNTVKAFFSSQTTTIPYQILYPGDTALGLQRLGELAGWHHPSPFWVGVDQAWGSWFAYRAVVLAGSDFELSSPVDRPAPCNSCEKKACISACPAGALESGQLNLERCSQFRLAAKSPCAYRCHARVACPVGSEQRYSDEQINYHYGVSLETLRQYYS